MFTHEITRNEDCPKNIISSLNNLKFIIESNIDIIIENKDKINKANN